MEGEVEMVERVSPDPLWLHFVIRHVQIHSRNVSTALLGRDMEEAREIVLEFLDGYLVWLNEDRRSLFKQSIYRSTTVVNGAPSATLNAAEAIDLSSLNQKERNRLANSYALTTKEPKTAAEARRNLEAYYVLWRSIFTLCETACHSANRVAQLFDYEVSFDGPVCKLARLLAFSSENGDSSASTPSAEQIVAESERFGICITELDVSEFYQDGLKAMEERNANLDDLHDTCDFRIKIPKDKPLQPGHSLPALQRGWLRKTFYEPEGVKAGIVAMRNYYPILHFNIYLTLAAWAWFEPTQVTATTMILADGVATVIGCFLEIVSRWSVYPCRVMCKPVLPWWSLLLWFLSYLIGVAELGLWVLGVQLKILTFSASLTTYVYLGAFGAAVLVRILHNILLFFRFPTTRPNAHHHKYRATSCSLLNRLFWKSVIFLLTTTGILVPLYYWFVVPTLQRSAFWTFCDSPLLVTKIQCYIGIIGLWIPLLSVILIMDFIAYAIVLAFYGAYLAQANQVSSQQEEAFSVMNAFRAFSSLLRRWTVAIPRGQNPGQEPEEPIPIAIGSTPSSLSKKAKKKLKKAAATIDATQATSSSVDEGAGRSKSKKSKKSKSSASSGADGDDMASEDASGSVIASEKAERPVVEAHAMSVESEFEAMMSVWYLIVDDLIDMDLISKDMAKSMYSALNWQSAKIGRKPRDIIQFFFSSLGALSPDLLDSLPQNYLSKLAPLTQLIPSYGEAVIFDMGYLCNRENKPLSNLEFLVLKYPKEWTYFFERTKRAYGTGSHRCYGTGNAAAARANGVAISAPFAAASPPTVGYSFPETKDEMLLWFLQAGSGLGAQGTTHASIQVMHPDLMDEIRLWASLRGQTLYKTIRGTLSYRVALSAIYEVTNHGSEMANTKCQVILAHQQYGDPSILKQMANDTVVIYKKLSCPSVGHNMYGETPFDLVFDWSPRDLMAQDSFRKKLSQQQNEEIIRRYALKSIFNETEKICSFGEALKRLIDVKAGPCPIDAKQGFPHASILAGLPTATQIRGTSWLFKYRGNLASSAEFSFLSRFSSDSQGGNGGGSAASSALGDSSQNLSGGFSNYSSDEEDTSTSFDGNGSELGGMNSDAANGRTRKRKPEVFKWDFVSCGSTVIHSPVHGTQSRLVDNTPGWLRCFNAETGREFDFLLHSANFDVLPVSFIKVPAKSVRRLDASSALDLQSLSEDASRKHGFASSSVAGSSSTGPSMLDPAQSSFRIYAVVKFGVRGADTSRGEMFSIVTCLNDDLFSDIIDGSSRKSYGGSIYQEAIEDETVPLSKVDKLRTTEKQCLQRALTKSSSRHANGNVISASVDVSRLTRKGKMVLESVEALREVASEFANERALLGPGSRHGSRSNMSEPVSHASQSHYGGDEGGKWTSSVNDEIFLGIEVKSVMPRRNPLIMRIAGEMPFGEADRIQGKAANQMNGLRFAFGLIIQTKDANQGGNVAEALKFPIILSKFDIHLLRDRHDQLKYLKKWAKTNLQGKDAQTAFIAALTRNSAHTVASKDGSMDELTMGDGNASGISQNSNSGSSGGVDSLLPIQYRERSVGMEDQYERDGSEVILPPVIVGFRESVFTRGHGAVARFQAYAEWAFGTIVQRVLSRLGLRMHYGHPDFFSAAWVFSRSALSKANPVYNLSEDIFAGYMAMLSGRRSVHTDKIQDEKGRDTALGSTYTFTAKLAQGAASQIKSRDIFDLYTRLDFLRYFLLFHSSLGYYFTTTAMLASVKMYLFGLLVFSLAGYSAENLGNLQFIYSVPFLVQVGMFTLLPLILEVAVEEGVWAVLKVVVDLPFSLGYFLFQGQTTCHHLIESFAKGKSHYEATGRLLGVSRKSLVDLYQLYGRSHLEPAMDYLFYVVVYYIVSSSRFGGYLPLFAPIICIIVFIIAPTGFQLGTSLKGIFNDIGEFGRWIYTTESFGALLKEWRSAPMREQMIKNLTWKATFKVTHTRLQTYSIFNYLKTVLSTHWRVDLATALSQTARIFVWGFIIVSIPGTMKDSVLKVLIGFSLYLMLNLAISANTPAHGGAQRKRGCWHSFSNLFYVLSIAYFVALFVILGGYRYLGDCAVGVFLALKFLKSLASCVFHLYTLAAKVRTSSKWRAVERDAANKKIGNDERDRATKEMKANLEKHIIAGLYILETIDRPILMLSISVVVIPIHTLFSLLWAIPHLSELLMHSISLKPKVSPDDLSRAPSRFSGMFMGSSFGFNTFASPDDFNELPAFDFEDDADVFY